MTDRPPIEVRTVSGNPSFAAAMHLEQQMRLDAGMDDGPVQRVINPAHRSPTSFHIASIGARPIGAATTTTGPLADLPLGLALARAGVELPDEYQLPGPACELVGFAVDDEGDCDTDGVAELLYRAFYRHARSSGAMSLVVSIDGWMFDIMRDAYGVPFTALGPPLDLLGREQLPAGGAISALEAAIKVSNPAFHKFLTSQ